MLMQFEIAQIFFNNKRIEIKFYCVKYVIRLCNENGIESYITVPVEPAGSLAFH